MGSASGGSRPRGGRTPSADYEPDYLLGALRRQFEGAVGFTELCRHVAPELEKESSELADHDRALFEAVVAVVQRNAVR